MSSSATDPNLESTTTTGAVDTATGVASPTSRGKGKNKATDTPMNEEEDDDEEEEEEEDEEDEEDEDEDDDEAEDALDEIDPSSIVTGGRRTRGIRVDYTSKEALEKAGLKGNEEEDEDEDVIMS